MASHKLTTLSILGNSVTGFVTVEGVDSELATLPLGGPTSGGPSMYEHGGRQYLLVTASPVQPTGPGAVPTPHKGPTGLIAYALPR